MTALADIHAARQAKKDRAKGRFRDKLVRAAQEGNDNIHVIHRLPAPGIYAICADLERDPYFADAKLFVEHHPPVRDNWNDDDEFWTVYICSKEKHNRRACLALDGAVREAFKKPESVSIKKSGKSFCALM